MGLFKSWCGRVRAGSFARKASKSREILRRAIAPVLENLESRQLLSANLINDTTEYFSGASNEYSNIDGTGSVVVNNNSTLSVHHHIRQGGSLTIGNSALVKLNSSEIHLNGTPEDVTVVTGLSIANNSGALGSRVYYGTLDIGTRTLVIDYTGGSSPLAEIEDMVRAGYDGGAQDGTGIVSSVAHDVDPLLYNVAVYDNGERGNIGFGFGDGTEFPLLNGVVVPEHSIVVRFTYSGDFDLNGRYSDDDGGLSGAFYDNGANPGHHWFEGDLNHDGYLTATGDLDAFNASYNITRPSLAATSAVLAQPMLSHSADPNRGGVNAESVSEAGVGYADGVLRLSSTDLFSTGFEGWGQTRSFTNAPDTSDNINGNGWVISQLPRLKLDGESIREIRTGSASEWFDPSGEDEFSERFFGLDTLTHDGGSNEYVLKDSAGGLLRFNDFNAGIPEIARGQFKSYTGPSGNTIEVTSRYATSGYEGLVQEVRHSTPGIQAVEGEHPQPAVASVLESYLYTYSDIGGEKRITNVTLRRSHDEGSTWSTIRQVDYTYYDGSYEGDDAFGNLGDLKSADVKDATGNILDSSFYRYYVPGDEDHGYVGGLKYVFDSCALARMATAEVDAASDDDETVAPFADRYIEYSNDDWRRVTKVVVQGAGNDDGKGTYIYAYEDSANEDGFNSWKFKTLETLPDGSENRKYFNYVGGEMLGVFDDGEDQWGTFTKYDAKGRDILDANPSAVDLSAGLGTLEGYSDLLHDVTGKYQYLRDNAGKLFLTEYGDSTTADETVANDTTDDDAAGDIEDFVSTTSIQHGENGTAILQSSTSYFIHTVNGVTTYPVASTSVYSDTAGMDDRTTTFDYEFFDDSVQIQHETVTHPLVSAAQNGPNSTSTSEAYFDIFGRGVWSMDEEGYINSTQYDPDTGAVIENVTDVDTGDLDALAIPDDATLENPGGWETPVAGGLQLITTMQVDDLGRNTQVTTPNGNITYTRYNDPNHEVRVYAGWSPPSPPPEFARPTGALSLKGQIRPLDTTLIEYDSFPVVHLYREDRAGSYSESLTYAFGGGFHDVPDGTDSFDTEGIRSLSREYYDSVNGQHTTSERYYDLQADGFEYSTDPHVGGSSNFYTTTYDRYDNRGRLIKTTTPTGTISYNFYDEQGRLSNTWIGTDDSAAGEGGSEPWRPGENESGGNNMFETADYVYDNGGVGDGNLTSVIQHAGGEEADRETDYFYDWRNRQVASKAGVGNSDNVNTHPISFTVFDNLDEAVEQRIYDGDGVTITTTDGEVDAPSSSLLRAKSTSEYDDMGRVFAAHTFSVSPIDGEVSEDSIDSEMHYNKRGYLFASGTSGQATQLSVFDGAGRKTSQYSVAPGPAVLTNSTYTYDGDGNLIQSDISVVTHDGMGSRTSHTAFYYDALDRRIATYDVGTNGGEAFTRPETKEDAGTAAAEGDGRFSYHYFDDPLSIIISRDTGGISSVTFLDPLGRTKKAVNAFSPGIGLSTTPTDNTNQTTSYTYDGDDNVLTMTAELPDDAHQTTAYTYGVTPGGDNAIASNDLLASVSYPIKDGGSAGDPSSDPSDQQSYTYNALGEQTTYTDQNGTTHTYEHDVLGRVTSDSVVITDEDVDDAVVKLGYEYDTQGNMFRGTSYDDGDGVVNQTTSYFNGLGQLTDEYQSHDGEVDDDGLDDNDTAHTHFTYDDLDTGSRIDTMTYPNGRVLHYVYDSGDQGTIDDAIGRVSALADDDGEGNPGTDLEEYTYLGDGTIVEQNRPEAGTKLSYIQQDGDTLASSDGGDAYTGLDRFGEVIDQNWIDTTSGDSIDRLQYGYDSRGNVLFKNNLINPLMSELYHADSTEVGDDNTAYDPLNRQTAFQRGSLEASENNDGVLDTIDTPSGLDRESEAWDLDALGNWKSQTVDGTPTEREHNSQNQLVGIGNDTQSFDSNGSVVTDSGGNDFTYDAWGRLVNYDGTDDATFAYSADGQRIVEDEGGVTNDLYYSPQGQVIEERNDDATTQYVWSMAGGNAMVERDVIPNEEPLARHTLSLSGPGSGTRLYAENAPNGDVISLVDPNAPPETLTGEFGFHELQPFEAHRDGDGWSAVLNGGDDVFSTEYSNGVYTFKIDDSVLGLMTMGSFTYSHGHWTQVASGEPLFLDDADPARVVERFVYDPSGNATVANDEWTPEAGNESTVGWKNLQGGARLDPVTGTYFINGVDYDPKTGRFIERGPNLATMQMDCAKCGNRPNLPKDIPNFDALFNRPEPNFPQKYTRGDYRKDLFMLANLAAAGCPIPPDLDLRVKNYEISNPLDAALERAPAPPPIVDAGPAMRGTTTEANEQAQRNAKDMNDFAAAQPYSLIPTDNPFFAQAMAITANEQGMGWLQFTAMALHESMTPIVLGLGSSAGRNSPTVMYGSSRPKVITGKGGVYLLRDVETDMVMRTGKSNNLETRKAAHFRDPALKDYRFETVYRTDVYEEQRGLEQDLDWRFNPPLNYNRAVRPGNPNLPDYLRAANEYLDRLKANR